MSASEDTVLGLVGMIYDAALDERKWPLFLDAFARAVGGGSSLLLSTDGDAGAAGYVASVGFDPAWQEAYIQHFVDVDYLTPALYQYKVGEVKSSDQVFSLSEQRKTEFFNDWPLTQDKVHAMGALLAKDGNHSLLFAVQRGKRAGAFSEEEARLTSLLTPHVTRAMQVHRKIRGVTAEKELALGALDRLRAGVILANCLGAPLFINRAAERMLSLGKGIGVCHDRLDLPTPAETVRLHQLIAAAAQGVACGGDSGSPCPMAGSFCTVWSRRFRWNYLRAGTLRCRPVVLPFSSASLAACNCRRNGWLYCTNSVRQMAAMLAACKSLELAAQSLGVSVQTARSQLKAIFAKTGTHSQSELLMLLASGTLAHCRDDL